VNKVVNGVQCTIVCYVHDLKISHRILKLPGNILVVSDKNSGAKWICQFAKTNSMTTLGFRSISLEIKKSR
jgi:serine/threonine protein kinase